MKKVIAGVLVIALAAVGIIITRQSILDNRIDNCDISLVHIEQINKELVERGTKHEFLITNNMECDLKSIEFAMSYSMKNGEADFEGQKIRLLERIEVIPSSLSKKIVILIPKDYYLGYIEGDVIDDMDITIEMHGYLNKVGPANNYSVAGGLKVIEDSYGESNTESHSKTEKEN